MDLAITNVPVWVSVLFLISFWTIPVFLIANTAKKVLYRIGFSDAVPIRKYIITFYWVYLTLVALCSLTGFFGVNVLPPRIIIFTTIPLFLFYTLFISKKNWLVQVMENITLPELIYLHVFRFVGVFFFINFVYGALPKNFAFIGGGGDILTAILVFPVIYFLKQKKYYAKTLVWIWNIIGLIDIISVLTTAVITTRNAIAHNTAGVAEFGTFPFSWIPAFAPATIIFLHLLIFKKLIQKES